MKKEQAIKMLTNPDKITGTAEHWADLGCGTGTFTIALAQILGKNSRILAVDKDDNSLKKIRDQINGVPIQKRAHDFLELNLESDSLDGILMANSLHYVSDPKTFIQSIAHSLKPNGCFLIVEYDTHISNPWIPYPINFVTLKSLFSEIGFSSIKKINEIPSRYNRANLYSAIVEKVSAH